LRRPKLLTRKFSAWKKKKQKKKKKYAYGFMVQVVTRFEMDGAGKPISELTNFREAEMGFRS
jgi:hypothetical protein